MTSKIASQEIIPMNSYRMKYRPAGIGTLPPGIGWNYKEAPALHGLANRPDLPRSAYTFGVITTDRPLTAQEMADFEIMVAA